MAVPTRKQLETWAEAYVRTWNEGDSEAWCQSYQDIAPGEYTMWDRLRAPIRSRACFYLTSCRLSGPKRGFELPIHSITRLTQQHGSPRIQWENFVFSGRGSFIPVLDAAKPKSSCRMNRGQGKT